MAVRCSKNVHGRSSQNSIAIVDKGLARDRELGNGGRRSFWIEPPETYGVRYFLATLYLFISLVLLLNSC